MSSQHEIIPVPFPVHPEISSSLSKGERWNLIPGWNQRKKTCKHFFPRWN